MQPVGLTVEPLHTSTDAVNAICAIEGRKDKAEIVKQSTKMSMAEEKGEGPLFPQVPQSRMRCGQEAEKKVCQSLGCSAGAQGVSRHGSKCFTSSYLKEASWFISPYLLKCVVPN